MWMNTILTIYIYIIFYFFILFFKFYFFLFLLISLVEVAPTFTYLWIVLLPTASIAISWVLLCPSHGVTSGFFLCPSFFLFFMTKKWGCLWGFLGNFWHFFIAKNCKGKLWVRVVQFDPSFFPIFQYSFQSNIIF
jgi:hypothetical protein